MQIDLVIRKEGDSNPYTISCDLAGRLVFGRSLVSPVNLTGSEISREHFALFSRHGEICVQDLSSNGTIVNGKPVLQKKPQKLSDGDVISVPGYKIELNKRLPNSQHHDAPSPISPQLGKVIFRWSDSLTVWELIIIAAAIGSFALVIYQVMQ